MHIKNISNTIVRLKQTQIQWIEKKIIYFILAQQRQRRHRRLFCNTNALEKFGQQQEFCLIDLTFE